MSESGSRRRRIWEFEGFAHCQVIGVCLPITSLRQLVAKLCGVPAAADDYALHCRAIAECEQRSALAEAVQRVLDQRNTHDFQIAVDSGVLYAIIQPIQLESLQRIVAHVLHWQAAKIR